jgi:hypothetical protein
MRRRGWRRRHRIDSAAARDDHADPDADADANPHA